jgi:hypothetical protein
MSKHTSHANRGITSNLVFILLAVVAAIGLAVGGYALFNADTDNNLKGGPAPMENAKPVDAGVDLPLVQLDGTWAAERNGSKFLATVADNKITIEFGSDGTSMVYYYGTFKSAEEKGTVITSTALDTDKLVMSGAKQKAFTVEQNVIWFDFEAMGMKTKVGLTRG